MSRLKSKLVITESGSDYRVYDLPELMSYEPSEHKYRNSYGIRFYEHPIGGGDVPVIAVLDGVAWNCGFYDPWNGTDQDYITDQASEMNLSPSFFWDDAKRQELAENLRRMKVGVFATHDSLASLQTYVEGFSGAERALASTIMGITMNTTLEVTAKRILETR